MHEDKTTALLSASDIREFQALLRHENGATPSADQTEQIVRRLLRLYRLCETAGKAPRREPSPKIALGGHPATQRNLETEATLALRTLQEHLAHVGQRPSTWRWAIVALHSALKHSLQARLVAGGTRETPSEDLCALFRSVSEIMPELPQVQDAIQQIDMLRWKYLAKQLSLWPVKGDALATRGREVLRVIARLRRPEDALVAAIGSMLSALVGVS